MKSQRQGIHIKCRQVDPEVRSAMVRFAKWLRLNFEFPIRVPVYLSSREKIRTKEGLMVSASFWAPDDPSVEPYIRIATGDYIALRKEFGKYNALASTLCSLAHEVIHYSQWCKKQELSEKGVVRRACLVIDRYLRTVDRFE